MCYGINFIKRLPQLLNDKTFTIGFENFFSRGCIISLEGINFSGKSSIAKALEAELRKNNIYAKYIKTLTKENIFGELFYRTEWYKLNELDPILIIGSSFAELYKFYIQNRNKNSFDQQYVLLLDRYILSAIAYLAALRDVYPCKKDPIPLLLFFKNKFHLPDSNLEIILTCNEVALEKRYSLRYGKKVDPKKATFLNYINEKFRILSVGEGKVLIDTSEFSFESCLSEITKRIIQRILSNHPHIYYPHQHICKRFI